MSCWKSHESLKLYPLSPHLGTQLESNWPSVWLHTLFHLQQIASPTPPDWSPRLVPVTQAGAEGRRRFTIHTEVEVVHVVVVVVEVSVIFTVVVVVVAFVVVIFVADVGVVVELQLLNVDVLER